MTEKQMLTRVQHKHDIEANWEKAKTFIPKNGEIIVYDADETHLRPRIKIGDGIKTVGNLDFITDESSSMVSGKTIVQNTNLDELTAYGNYMCTTFAVLKTLLNCPTDKLFTMRVGPAVPGYSDRLYQEIITRTGIRFYRNANVTDGMPTWEDWKRTFDENSFYVPTKFGGIDFNSSFERGREAHLESCQTFVNKMNEVAVQLGMTNTTYKTPSGLCCVPINKDERDPKFDIAYNSYTTAYDQLRLMIAARHSPTVYQIMGTQKYSYIMNNNNAGFYRINHSILNSEEWITWQTNNNYIIRAAKGGSLDGERSEMDGKPILNFMGIIESNSQLYAVAVVGLVNHEDDLRIVVKDLIEAVNTRKISQYLSDVTNQEKRKYPAGVAAAKLTSFTYDQDIDEALADGIFIEENRQYPSASLAKVMTGLVASSYLNNQECVLNYDDYIDSHDGLSPDFTPGCTTSIIEALHVSLMISHNSTTTMLARICGEKIKGTSVTIKSIEESAVDGGSNIITFSDGKTLTVRNGNTGAAGTNGKSAYDYAKDGGYTQSEANFTKALGKLDLSVALTASKSIPKGTDLDTITTYDNYKCTSQSILESLTNCPTKDFFSMRVGSTAKGVPNYHYQEIITIRGTRYYRDVTNILDGKLNWKPWEISFDTRTLIPANCGGMGLNISSDFGEEKHLAACNKFITKMNKTALEIGMINTEFKTPTGLCSESINSSKTNFDIKYNSHSTAYDYLRLMITVRHTPAVYEAMGQKNYRYFKNGEPKLVGHSNLDNSNWEKWQKDTGYTIRAIKGGSLDATYGEINGKPIMNFVFLIEDGTNNSYAVIVLGQDGTDTNNKYTVLRQYIEDLIDMTNGSPISETIQNATAPTVNGGFPVCMAAMKLTGGTYDSDIEALENSQNIVLLNAHESRVTASIAKVMSAIVAIRYMGNNLSQVNYDDMVGGGSSDTFVLGDIVSTTDAFNLMLGRSDNTMTTMLARICGQTIAIATDDEFLELLVQEDMLPAVHDSDGSFLADENENILLW